MSPYGEEQKADELAGELDEMYQHLKTTGINTDPEDVLIELETCNQYFARVSEIVAISGAILARAEGEFAEEYVEHLAGEKPQPTIFGKLMAAHVADEEKLVTYAKRLDAALDKRIKSLISTLSFGKENLRSINMTSGGRR